MTHPELEFFNSLSGKLDIELTTPPERVGDLLNERATPDAAIVSLKLTAEVFNEETETFRPLTPEELDSVAYRGASIRLRSEDGDPVAHAAPNGEFFTVRQLLQAVEETERQTRGQSEWLGGVDVHHVFFEGIHREDEDDDDDEDEDDEGDEADSDEDEVDEAEGDDGDDDVWEIYWGS